MLTSRDGAQQLRADPVTATTDSDGDFLPDVVEWVCLSNPLDPDTDGDGVPDFIEVVQRGNPAQAGPPLVPDHEMRVVVTAVPCASGGNETYMHLLMRFVGGSGPAQLNMLDTWLQLPSGVRVPLNGLAQNPLAVLVHHEPGDGHWVQVTVPLSSEAVIRNLLPCTVGATADIGGRSIETAMPLFDHAGATVSLVRFDDARVAIQPIGAVLIPGGGSNRVCVLGLRVVGTGPGGTVVQVVTADCVDYNDLDCAPLCTQSVGSTFTIPGGPAVVTGG